MFHGLNNSFLYSAYKITALFADDIGNLIQGTGTCFFVENKNKKLCLVTNRHVLDTNYKKPDSLKKFSIRAITVSGRQDSSDEKETSFSIIPIVTYHKDSNNDIACIKNIAILGSKQIKIDPFIPYSFLAQQIDFQDKLSICDFLAFPGFPEWHDKLASRPILRTGTISSDPRFDYAYGDTVRGACLAFEAFSYSGSSGSPVFAVQKGPKPGNGIDFPGFRELLLIGVNAGHLKVHDNSHSGISYLYKSTAIIEVIDN